MAQKLVLAAHSHLNPVELRIRAYYTDYYAKSLDYYRNYFEIAEGLIRIKWTIICVQKIYCFLVFVNRINIQLQASSVLVILRCSFIK